MFISIHLADGQEGLQGGEVEVVMGGLLEGVVI